MDAPEPASALSRAVREASAAVTPVLVRLFPWHAAAFLAVNAAITAVNVSTGAPWWGLWPFLATAVLLGLHYLIYKAAAVDQRWVDARVEELNLKSYDRSHIEGLKARHAGGARKDERDAGPAG